MSEPGLLPDTPESLGRVGHDLKNLLGVILGFTDMILRDLAPDDPGREELLEIRKAAESALELAARIMDVARTREGA